VDWFTGKKKKSKISVELLLFLFLKWELDVLNTTHPVLASSGLTLTERDI
jgi:hypothetical protein